MTGFPVLDWSGYIAGADPNAGDSVCVYMSRAAQISNVLKVEGSMAENPAIKSSAFF